MQRTRAVPRRAIPLALLLGLAAAPAAAQTPREHWVASWATSQELYRGPAATPAPGGPAATPSTAPGLPAPAAAAPGAPPLTVRNQTVRMVVRTSLGGRRARLRLANAFGAAPVTFGAVHVAARAEGARTVPGSDRAVTFGGKATVTLAPGVVVVSDPVEVEVPANGDLVVSLYVPGDAGRPATHALGMHTTYLSPDGDFSGAADFPEARTTQSYYWLAALDVAAGDDAQAVVGFGDSITDGARSTPDANHNWPALLAERLAANPATRRVAVVNQGISGNQVLRDGAGVSALARLDRDVLAQSGARWVMLLEGINDIGSVQRGVTPAVTADQLIWAYRQIIDRAHAQGLRVVGCTLTPFEGAGYFSEAGEAIRDAVNRWVRAPGNFDAVADFDAATRDPAHPRRLRAEFDPGDHLHPNDAGYRAMADAVDLSIFRAGRR